MSNNTRMIAVTTSLSLMALVAMLTIPLWSHADSRTESIIPQMGMMRSGQNVIVVNLGPVDVETHGMALGHATLEYGEKCYMFKGAQFAAVGVDGQRVLVRSRVRGPHQLYDEGAPVCAGDVLFWIGYQQYLLSAQAFREAEREESEKETATERDRRIIRQLLDQQLTRK